MKKIPALLVALLLAMPAGWGQTYPRQTQQQEPQEPREPAAQEPQYPPDADEPGDIPDVVSIPAGTRLPMTIVRAPQESQAREGMTVYLRTRTPLRTEGGAAIPARTLVVGVLTSNPTAGPGNSTLSIRLKAIVLPDHDRLPISGRVIGTIGGPKGPTAAAVGQNPMAALSGLSPEQIAMISTFALVGAEIGQAVGKNQKGTMIGTLVGGGIGVATVLAINGSHLNLRVGANVEGVLEEPLTLDQRNVR